jgi:predicted secreted acid phosphatase
LGKQYRILLYIGDNMNDFVAGVRVKPQERMKLAIKHRERWGRQWILLPNPIYGTWEQSLYDFDYQLSYSDKVKRKYGYLADHK